jgi:hypothetical protein
MGPWAKPGGLLFAIDELSGRESVAACNTQGASQSL